MSAEETWGRKLTRRVHEALRQRIRELIPGKTREARVSEALHKNPQWLKGRRRDARIELGALFDVLGVLRLEPEEFFEEALDHDCEGASVVVCQVLSASERAATLSPSALRAELERLDRLRYDQPKEAVSGAEIALRKTPPSHLAEALGLLGSCYRMVLKLEEGEHALSAAMARTKHPKVLANLYQRRAYVAGDRGEYYRALRRTEAALVSYATIAEIVGIGKVLVDLGMWRNRLGDWAGGAQAQEGALSLLPEEAVEYRCAAHQALCHSYRGMGDLSAAKVQAEVAWSFSDGLSLLSSGKLLWLRGGLEAELGHLERSERFLQEARNIFKPVHAGDAALVAVDLVRVQLDQHRPEAARSTAKETLQLIHHSENQIIAAAVQKLTEYSLVAQKGGGPAAPSRNA